MGVGGWGGTPGRGRSDRPTHGHSGAMGRTTHPLGSSRFGTGLGAAPWWGAGERISAQAPLIPCCCDGAGGGSPRPPLPSLGCSAHSESRGGGQGGPAWCPYGGGEAVGPPPHQAGRGLGDLPRAVGQGGWARCPEQAAAGGRGGQLGWLPWCVCVWALLGGCQTAGVPGRWLGSPLRHPGVP